MKKTNILALAAGLLYLTSQAQVTDPMITDWWFNTTNNTYNGVLTDVEAVYYTTQNIYVKTSGVPNYYLDGQSVNNAVDQDATWLIPRVPSPAGTPAGIQGGQTGLMLDGSVFFHPGDAQSYNNAGVWNRLAYYFEGQDMDDYNGHSTPNDHIYHHHFDNLALHDFDTTVHSPIVGYAWDGYPVYGPYGYQDANTNGGATMRMRSSYKKQTYTTRTNGPAVGGQYPIGCFIEDWVYTAGHGNLDEHNGRFCKTPEYPNGTYAYFTTIDQNNDPEYPYFVGPTFYGTFTNANLGPNGGNTTVPANATLYTPATSAVDEVAAIESNVAVFPIPVVTTMTIELKESRMYTATIYDVKGIVIRSLQINSTTTVDLSDLSYGTYFLRMNDETSQSGFVKRFVKR